MRIRKYRDEDAAAIARLHRGTVLHVNKNDYSKRAIRAWLKRTTAANIRASAAKRNRFVAIQQEKVVGVAGITDNEIRGMYVHKDHQREGIGSKLLKRIEQEAQKNSVKTLHVKSSPYAVPFYKKHSYKKLKTCTEPRFGLTCFKMQKRLK
ncbi:MAG: GNAT family N-acetyltransferase [Candidatus Woesearchaeota archaeon]|nr:GNAT family N-acetyltransferase [Candidatus Woesearchaeota archaeon]